MKVKIIIAETSALAGTSNYENDYNDVIRFVVDSFTEWEEVNTEEYSLVYKFVREFNNTQANKVAFLLKEDALFIPTKTAIAEILKREEAKKEALEKKNKERIAAAKEREKKSKEKSLERKKKQLEKLKKELGENNP